MEIVRLEHHTKKQLGDITMSLVLKSNQVAKNYITTYLQSVLPAADYSFVFANGEYKYKQEAVSLSSISNVIRNGSPLGYVDADGQYNTAGATSPRIHHDAVSGTGVLIEPARTNLLPEPTNPVSRELTLNLSVSNFLKVAIWGSGSVTISIEGKFNEVVTKDKPFSLWLNKSESATMSISVAGSVEYCVVCVTPSHSKIVSKLVGTSLLDSFTLFRKQPQRKTTLVAKRKILTDSTTSVTEMYKGNRAFTFAQFLPISTGALTFMDVYGPDYAFGKEVSNGSAKKNGYAKSIMAIEDADEVIAITVDLDTNKVHIFQDGIKYLVDISVSGFPDINRIALGNGLSGGALISHSQLFKEVLLYDYIVDDGQLMLATS